MVPLLFLVSSLVLQTLAASNIPRNQVPQVRTVNNCNYTVWVGVYGSQSIPENGGWALNPGENKTVDIALAGQWNGRFWGRTDCDASGKCSTGQCAGIECKGTTGEPPASLFEITFNGYQGMDFYDISLVDGYNVPIKVAPIPGTFQTSTGTPYDCTEAGCESDLNVNCPSELALKYNDRVVGCKSACAVFNTDQYCCRGAFGTPDKCPPTDYSRAFKQACPKAYSYAYDDQSSTFTCHGLGGSGGASYELQFC